MSVTATLKSELTVIETLDGSAAPFAASTDKTITHNGLNSTQQLTGATGVPVTKTAAFEQALTAGTATIDLTALVGTNGGVVSFSGLKVQCVKLKAKATNANPILIEVGAANGYELAGAGFSVELQPGQEVTLFLNDAAPDVGGTAKTLDLTGTGSQVLQCQFVAG